MAEQGTPPFPDADRDPVLASMLCFAIYSAGHAFTQFYRASLEPMGLTYPQSLVMTLLWERDNRSVREIGAAMHLKSSTLTPLIKRLAEAGLVNRQRDSGDERVVRITLTDKGRALQARAAEIAPHVREALQMSEDEIAQAIATLDRIRARLVSATP
ncbi:hypothetical protein ATO3_05060 [Marinibacterium profundimaris]|uniref:HTH marR-type domain-containing protein n=2 Tax=Marinibacterium profundimaris TaxID=1679460 RepID=A0A225NR80_9RHOB|nr:hypothetical protein ATO3_05060 [Marinibacterium profundimaris]